MLSGIIFKQLHAMQRPFKIYPESKRSLRFYIACQSLRFVNWHIANLESVKKAIQAVPISSDLGAWLQRYGQTSAGSLLSMFSRVDLKYLENTQLYTDEMLDSIRGCPSKWDC
jgi:hypothetical protein